MIVRCHSCSSTLRANEDRLGGRTTAKCPRCGTSLDLGRSDANAPRIKLACSSCGAMLRAPASRIGTKSPCPKCGDEVLIGEQPIAASGAAPATPTSDDSTGAATRRIDSRTLGLGVMGMPATHSGTADVDLDEFIKPRPGREQPSSESAPDEDRTESLLNPPIESMREAVEGIRQAADTMSPPAAEVAVQAPPEAEKAASRPAPEKAPVRPPRAPSRPRSSPVPSGRGLLSGAMAGLLVGGGWALASGPLSGIGLSALVAVLPPLHTFEGVPDASLRAGLVAVLGAVAGFIAAATSAPRTGRRSPSIVRCGSVGMLAGAVAGLITTLASGSAPAGFSIWPTLNWTRDLLLVGLLTPAFNSLVPGARS